MDVKPKYVILFASLAALTVIGMIIFSAILISPGSHSCIFSYHLDVSKKVVNESKVNEYFQNSPYGVYLQKLLDAGQELKSQALESSEQVRSAHQSGQPSQGKRKSV